MNRNPAGVFNLEVAAGGDRLRLLSVSGIWVYLEATLPAAAAAAPVCRVAAPEA